ncbi:carbohydrate esterase family 16 protein [Dothistroma septosporum NZE10]|uniref:Carbohydrate esterase family 16 protein n=1 Tax=Dothistroma septosporum (strain NZE10 / CBS 128990) TaxID=675120 RepID=N1PRY3_DOTSN|nr:carbohydrate esterase family 16 protein [Dothistroma septosporum NZE10]
MLLVSILTILLSCFSTLVQPRPDHALSWQDTKQVIAFGDSYTCVQGSHGRQKYSFIGDVQTLSYNVSTLLSNEIVHNQIATAEGGPNWLEFLTGCGLQSGLMNPRQCERQLWYFAFAGADISEEFPETSLHHNFTVSSVRQIEQFKSYGHPVLETFIDMERTLVTVWIRTNDINDSADSETAGNRLRVQKGQDAMPNKTMVQWWNRAFEMQVGAFEDGQKGARARLFDANALLNGMTDEPAAYGIRDITGYFGAAYNQPYINEDPASYGCLPLDEYFWFDTAHLTSHVHKIIAMAVEAFL